MKWAVVGLALVLFGTSLVALAPAGDARGFCVTGVDRWCPGVFCVWKQRGAYGYWECVPPRIDCVTEPCP